MHYDQIPTTISKNTIEILEGICVQESLNSPTLSNYQNNNDILNAEQYCNIKSGVTRYVQCHDVTQEL